jgi:hypothetical protein
MEIVDPANVRMGHQSRHVNFVAQRGHRRLLRGERHPDSLERQSSLLFVLAGAINFAQAARTDEFDDLEPVQENLPRLEHMWAGRLRRGRPARVLKIQPRCRRLFHQLFQKSRDLAIGSFEIPQKSPLLRRGQGRDLQE